MRDYVDARVKAVEVTAGATSTSLEKRLEGMNEFRQQLNLQTQTFLTRTEYDAKQLAILQKVEGLSDKIEQLQKPVWIGIGVALVGELVLKFFIK